VIQWLRSFVSEEQLSFSKSKDTVEIIRESSNSVCPSCFLFAEFQKFLSLKMMLSSARLTDEQEIRHVEAMSVSDGVTWWSAIDNSYIANICSNRAKRMESGWGHVGWTCLL
jgi:hypothetical protein